MKYLCEQQRLTWRRKATAHGYIIAHPVYKDTKKALGWGTESLKKGYYKGVKMSICWEQFNSNSSKFFKQQKSSRAESESLRNKNEKSTMVTCGSRLLYFRRRVDAMDR
ncbi:hypothetical protein AWJ15_14505 [Lacticaseibacillus rhamnosus]|nr:hypothetical protein AWJ15_14505 [Lacticaseibacillus rhamnosus]